LLKKNKKLLELTEECGKSRKRLETLFNEITDKILVIDSDFNIEMTNKSEMEDSGKCYKKLFDRDLSCDNCPAIKTFKTQKATTTEIEISDQYFLLQAYNKSIFHNLQILPPISILIFLVKRYFSKLTPISHMKPFGNKATPVII